MRRVAVRIPSSLARSIDWYGRAAGLVRRNGQLDISETLRDLIARGLVEDRSTEAGYRAGYAAGRSAGYADFMRATAQAASGSTPTPRGRTR